jgi:UMF1 family MFS transporter
MTKNDPRVTTGWAMYDWANSVYPLVITSTIFPIYFNSQAEVAAVARDSSGRSMVEFFGIEVLASSLLIYAISTAFLIVAAVSPLLTALADYSGRKKRFMQFFCYLGSLSCAGLFFFTAGSLSFAVLLYILATVGFAGSIVFYNSYLPDIASEDRVDSLSAKGFSFGYIGSALLLVCCLGLVLGASALGIDRAMGSRVSFLLTGLWWGGFALIPFTRLPRDPGRAAHAPAAVEKNYLFNGYRQLARIWDELRHLPALKRFLLSYFFSCTGVQTVMYVATLFADEELGMGQQALIVTILILQLVGVVGACFFAKLSDAIGNIRALGAAVTVWAFICAAGYFVQAGWSFYVLAATIGFAMGGVQSLSRSTYAKLIPEETPNSASWFSFFDVTEKLGIVIGTGSFSLISQLSGSMRNSLLALIVFFALGLALLVTLRGWVRNVRAAAPPPPPVLSGER